ncbi:MAG: alpha/beta fold hydrolase [Chlorobi bacterium]|nr:alpha/beta fold hydrolase [Chlorobiota bacterium]
MKLLKYLGLSTFLFLLIFPAMAQKRNLEGNPTFTTIEFNSTDGLKITADLYQIEDANAPYIILFHQARYSRGEYREIAPKLNILGFNCIAVDQRSGDKVNGVINETHSRAIEKGLPTEYTDAFPDLVASLLYVKENFKPTKTIVWGSSYSSALVFVLAAKYPDDVDGVLSFSPGDYFSIDGRLVSDFAKEVSCPVFITSAKNEQESWQPIYDNLSVKEKSFFLPDTKGFHGSKALWEENEGNQRYWKAVEGFLKA